MTQFCPEQNKSFCLNSIKCAFNKEMIHALKNTYFFLISKLMQKVFLGTLHGYEIYPEDKKLMNIY